MNCDEKLKIAIDALNEISTWRFGWDGDCGVHRVAEKALDALDSTDAPADVGELPPLPETTYNGYGDGSEPLYTTEMARQAQRIAIAHYVAAQKSKVRLSDLEGEFVFANKGEQPLDGSMDCPACGGSGHRDDAQPGSTQGERAALTDDQIYDFWIHRDCMNAIRAGDMRAQFISAVRAIEQAARAEVNTELAEWRRLKDPVTLHNNLLRGIPARLTPDQLRHIAGDFSDVAIAAKARAEVVEPVPVWELSDDGWDGVSELDGDWLKSLPVGTRLYYIGASPTTLCAVVPDEDIVRMRACLLACEGLSQDALDGGWTATGISAYAKSLEEKLSEKVLVLSEDTARLDFMATRGACIVHCWDGEACNVWLPAEGQLEIDARPVEGYPQKWYGSTRAAIDAAMLAAAPSPQATLQRLADQAQDLGLGYGEMSPQAKEGGAA